MTYPPKGYRKDPEPNQKDDPETTSHALEEEGLDKGGAEE